MQQPEPIQQAPAVLLWLLSTAKLLRVPFPQSAIQPTWGSGVFPNVERTMLAAGGGKSPMDGVVALADLSVRQVKDISTGTLGFGLKACDRTSLKPRGPTTDVVQGVLQRLRRVIIGAVQPGQC